jgi:tetratricopeptide (TPR) repeat protein
MKKFFGLLLLILIARDLRGAPLTRIIVVLPFVNLSTRPDLGWMSEGFAVALSRRLAGADRYVIDRRERNAAFEELGLNETAPTTLASTYKIARKLGVDWAVVGSFDLQANQLIARAQLLDTTNLTLSAPVEAAGELADLEDLETSLVWRMLAQHDPTFTVGKEDDFRKRFPDVRLDSFESYIRGILAQDPDSRVRYLTEADRRNPADHRAAFELARHYFEQKDYSQCSAWLRKLAPSDQHYQESLFLLGVSEYFLGQDKEAAKDFSSFIADLPLNEAFNNRGAVEYRSGDYQAALVDFERVASGGRSNGEFAFNHGVCLWALKRYSEAATALKSALNSDSEDAEAHLLLADTLVKLGDTAGVEEQRKWLASHGGSSDLPSLLTPETAPQPRVMKIYTGRAYRLLALKTRNAFEARVSNLPPAEHAAAHIARARELINAGRAVDAQSDLEEAASLAPVNNEAHLLLARVYEAEGRHGDAAAQLELSLRLDNSVAAQTWLAEIYLAQGLHQQALSHAQAALSLDPASASAAQIVREIEGQTSQSRSRP